jgi:hypothetical protein
MVEMGSRGRRKNGERVLATVRIRRGLLGSAGLDVRTTRL